MPSRKSPYLTVLFACALASSLVQAMAPAMSSASEPAWVQRHFGPTDGLPVSSANSARTDADGFLWIATHDGLARFDGVRFDVHDSMRFPAMSGNRVRSLHADAAGRVFALTEHGDWLTVRSGAIARAPMGQIGPQTVRHVDATSLCLTTATRLHCPDAQGVFAPRLTFPEGAPPALALAVGAENAWMVAVNGGVWHYWKGTWHLRGHLPESANITAPYPALASAEELWIGLNERLFHITDSGVTAFADAALKGTVLQLRQDADGRIWIGTTHALYRIQHGAPVAVFTAAATSPHAPHLSWQAPDGATWVRGGHRLWRFASGDIPPTPNGTPALETRGDILDLFFDAEGSVWVMTLRDGIHRLNRPRVTLLGEAAGLGGGNVYGVTQDAHGTLWMGTLGDGLKGLDTDGTLQHLGRDAGLPGENPWLVASTPEGGLLVATYAPGLWQRAPGEARFTPVPLPEELIGEQVLSISFDAAQQAWLGTTAGAWRREAGIWQRQWPTDVRRVRVNALAHADAGEFWLGGSEGVWRHAGGHIHPVADALLVNTSVRDLYRAADGTLWISTDGRGLIRVAADDPQGTQAIRLGRAQGLPSNSPHAVREDADGHVWVNSNQGIFRLSHANLRDFVAGSIRRLSPLVLGLSDGLTELEGNGGVQPSAALDRTGALWFPSQRGVVRIDPHAVPIRTRPPRVVIDAMESEGQPLALDAAMRLPVGMRNLLIRYNAADLHAGFELRFRHRLLPLEEGWTDATNGRATGFNGLPPGNYRFEVLAGNSDGVWADAPTTLDFRVPPRWFETAWFRTAALAALALAALLAMRARSRHLRQRTLELDRQVHQRTDELRTEKGRVETALAELSHAHTQLAHTHTQIETSNLRLAEQARRLEALDTFRTRLLADVSHELRTPVMLVSMPLRDLHARAGALPPAERNALDISLKQLDRLGGLVEQLVGLVQAESGQMPLRATRLDVAALLRELVASYRPVASRIKVQLALDAPDGEQALFADRSHFVTVLGNLIDNALKHAPPHSTVAITLGCDEERARIRVQDHGPGFDPALAERLFERFYRADGPPRHGREGLGIGLALARELIELHGGRIAAISTPGQGAAFTIELPLGSAHIALDDLSLEPARAAALPALPGTGGDGRILLVEDHPDLAAYLAERIGEHLPVACVGSAEAALETLTDGADIRLVISDVVLPGISGVELCRHLVPRALPVILISAKAADVDRHAGLAAGARAYLAKPFSFETLLAEIARAWPAAAPRLTASPCDPAHADPLLTIALDRLADARFSITDWAQAAHLSERQLRRRINEITGQSPQTWLREQRLLRVRHLLRNGTCKTLADAGHRCGLDNPAWLYRSYRARFGEH